MATVAEIFAALAELAPVERKMDFDNVGFLVGRGGRQTDKIITALDITDDVIAEAAASGAQLVVSHHPLFFSVKSITDESGVGRRVLSLAENGIAAICMHTNLDAANGGVNDALAKAVGLADVELLCTDGVDSHGNAYCCGRIGMVEPVRMAEFLPFVKKALRANGLRYHDGGKPVNRVAVIGGSGGSYLETAFSKGCDTIITADVKYDVFLTAKELGMNIIDGDHFCTENTVVPVLREYLIKRFSEIDVEISKVHGQTAQFMV